MHYICVFASSAVHFLWAISSLSFLTLAAALQGLHSLKKQHSELHYFVYKSKGSVDSVYVASWLATIYDQIHFILLLHSKNFPIIG